MIKRDAPNWDEIGDLYFPNSVEINLGKLKWKNQSKYEIERKGAKNIKIQLIIDIKPKAIIIKMFR